MKRFDLYGACGGSLEEVRLRVQHGLDRDFVLHESGYRGGEYFRAAGPPEEVLLQTNAPDEEGYYPEPEFREWPILVYINDSQRWGELDRRIAEIHSLVLLRSETV